MMLDQWETGLDLPTSLAASPRLLGVEAARERLGVGLTKFYEIVGEGELRTVKIGSRRLVSETAIDEYIRRLESAQSRRRMPQSGDTAA